MDLYLSMQLKPIFHCGEDQIGIYFSKNKEIEIAVRKTKGIKWSQTHRCWYLPLSRENYSALMRNVKEVAVSTLR